MKYVYPFFNDSFDRNLYNPTISSGIPPESNAPKANMILLSPVDSLNISAGLPSTFPFNLSKIIEALLL